MSVSLKTKNLIKLGKQAERIIYKASIADVAKAVIHATGARLEAKKAE